MDYNLKIVIGDVTLLEAQDITDDVTKTPSIANVMLVNSACSKTMEIGATASDRLVFTVINPEKTTYDGDIVEFYIQETDTLQKSKRVEIEEAVGNDTTSEIVSAESDSVTEENSEEEEPISAEDEVDAEETQEALSQGLDLALEGEFEETTTESLPSGEVGHEWKQVGVYYVYSQVNNSDGSITITAYDGFYKMNGIFKPTNYVATVANMFADLRTKAMAECGIEIDDEEFDGIEDTEISLFFTCSFREAIGYFAGLQGGFAEFGADGTCGISQYTFDDNNIIDSELITYNETSAGEMVVESLSCNTTRNALGTSVLESGSGGQDLVFINPLMTQELLDELFSRYQGMRFTGAVASLNWDDRINAGEFVRIFTEDEYANYIRIKNNLEQNAGTLTPEEISSLRDGMNHLGKIILISSQTIDFKGDAVTTITSICDSETTKANKMTAEVDSKLMQIYEDNVNTRELVVEIEQYASHAAEIVDDMEEYAEEAGKTLVQILTDGETASALAQQAIEDASSAQASASSANVYANSALTNLGLVENVLDTLTWITEHGYYQLTEDIEVVANKIYYTVTGTAIASPTGSPSLNLYYERSGSGTSVDPYVYTLSADTSVDSQKTYYTVSATSVADPTGDPSENGYYELNFNSALSQYVSSHLSLTDAGLTITNDNTTGSMLMSTNGIEIKNAGGVIVGKYGESAVIGAENAGHIEIKNGEIFFYSGAKATMIPYDPEADPFCVAYISDNELHIPRVVVVESLKMGKWKWDATVDYHLSLVWTD